MEKKQMTIKNMIGVDMEVTGCQVVALVEVLKRKVNWELTTRQQTIRDLLLAGF